MEMVLAFLGFLACLIALGYGLYHLVRYVLKKEKRFSKRLFWPLFIGGLVLLFTGAALAEPDTAAANAEKKYSALNAEYKNLTKEHEELEKEYKSVSSEAKKLKDNKEDQDKLALGHYRKDLHWLREIHEPGFRSAPLRPLKNVF